MKLINLFLKAKHWQIFLLTYGIPFIFQFVIFGFMISEIINNRASDPTFMFKYFKLFPILMLIFVVIFFGWFWSVAIGLQNKIPSIVKMKVKKFKIFFFIPIIYLIILSISILPFMFQLENIANTGNASQVGNIGLLLFIILPLHLFAMFCIFYAMYFVAKTYKTVELQRETSFSDFIGEFFLIWFFPIGIWFIQPKINKIVSN